MSKAEINPDGGNAQNARNGASAGNAIEVRELRRRFGRQQVLDGVTLDFPSGQITTIVGPSGSGKTVLLKHINLLLRPDSGSIVIDNVEVTKLGVAGLDAVREKFGMLFQA
ncbi:MAG: ATP-binding cassette domain-containing protein, partial [Candidatus Binatus sp.]|uniref:ATP-binding cassette domain-containing protein n=1 Tax=Candidatus Binatus sp. TaxID=2811406 RepID=UPI003C7817AA